MKPSAQHPQRQTTIKTLKLFVLFLLSSLTMHRPGSHTILSLPTQFTDDDDISAAATDFGNRLHFPPSSVVRPESVSDVARAIKSVLEMGPESELTLAARGHGHSLQGQAQAPGGIVVMTESLRRSAKAQVHAGNTEAPYIDVPASELWIDVLHESLKHGFAPKSWTDYLHLTVGGTLSNGGISGQAFRHGPQISNVQRLEIVTGKGDVHNCSDSENADLFHGALGGLGQFGIITRAQIALEPAPKKVKWIRALYSDFTSFVEDQEMLISTERTFDYIEGFVIINRTGLLNNWRSSFNPQDPVQASRFKSDGRTLFCLEMTKNLYNDESGASNQEVGELLSRLRFIPSTLFMSEVSYLEFLDRVHISEVQLRSRGLWEIPHPWLNLLVPRSRIHDFAEVVFGKILTESSNGPILIYPLNKSKYMWDNRTSAVIPNEEVFYLVALLSSAMDDEELARSLKRNSMILEFCDKADIGAKQYLPYFTNQDEWRAHFGSRWDLFVQRKKAYDPFTILAPGQRIFIRAMRSFS